MINLKVIYWRMYGSIKIAIIVLAIIQVLIFTFIYLPGYKVNRFKWDIFNKIEID